MAGWVSYTRKVLSSALTSIAGELEQTAQDFNDAFHNFSHPGTLSQPELRELTESVAAAPSTSLSSSCEEGSSSVPEQYVDGDSACASGQHGESHDVKGLISNTQIPTPSNPSNRHHSRGSRALDSSDSSSHLDTTLVIGSPTATTRQPEAILPLHPSQPLHSRLSQSSPSLSPLSHEGDDFSRASSDAEDDLRLPQLVPVSVHKPHSLSWNTARKPKAVRADQLNRPMINSVSTPCLIHVHKILPSCKRNFNCPSTTQLHTTPQKHNDNDLVDSIIHRCADKQSDTGLKVVEKSSRPPAISEMKVKKAAIGRCFISTKPPGKVVVVVSQPSSDGHTQSDQSKSLSSHIVGDEAERSPCATTTLEQQPISSIGLDAQTKDKANFNLHTIHMQNEDSEAEARSGSPQCQTVLRTVKSDVQIEREARSPRWPMLAPLARVLTFAYSQVVNAIMLLQEEESSNGSVGHNRSRASSMSRGSDGRAALSSSQQFSRQSSPVKGLLDLGLAQGEFSVTKETIINTSSHKRQPSQLSLAGSTLSSESFEVLDPADMESSGFFYVGDDAQANDILHEYHLYPSKSKISCLPASMSTAHDLPPHTTSTVISFSTCTPLQDTYSNIGNDNLMMSSSADFAHFDFGELISNRWNNKLNIPQNGAVKESGTSDGLEPQEGEVPMSTGEEEEEEFATVASPPNDSMFESFVVLEDQVLEDANLNDK